LGLTAGPVPPRVGQHVKAGLLDLIDHVVDRGWSARRAAQLLGLDHVRCGRWQVRRASGELADRAPGGHPLHGLLDSERAAIVALFQAWGEIDRSHRKLAHRGSRLGLVHV
jgi:putative transposase